ncbi:MAG: A/G-specific adenine glycosylase [Flavobacteriales bacterium]|nr:A/G-specific adenine glycosylase [Flavobacteriales bacterium]MCB9365134.1 A/G-specific adenine glycosylase [Flavobacteriales bacterium]
MDFSSLLIKWYKENKRDLPWRETTDPYKIWLSEIILQQTRVDQGLSYYLKFIKNFPTIDKLADAKEEKVLKLWQGLGYYSRARNLHFTAKHIVNNYNGKFPENYKELLALKGIGEYTAAAISSFSYNMPYPVVDGNVYRVLARFFDINTPIDSTLGKKEFKTLAEELIDKKNPAEYNQAIMEFGALQCTPKQPKCDDCVFNTKCLALKNNTISSLPFKEKKTKVTHRFFNYLVFSDKKHILIKNRMEKDIWQGLFDFPLIETTKSIEQFENLNLEQYKKLNTITNKSIHKSTEYIHILSHQKIHATFWSIQLNDVNNIHTSELKILTKEIENYPIPKLIENFIFKK